MVRVCREIEIVIEDGIKVETHGYEGDECDELAVLINKVFGQRAKSRRKPEGKRKRPHRVKNKETVRDKIRE